MKRITYFAMAVIALGVAALPATAANPTASALVEAELVQTVTLVKTVDMQFGKVALTGEGVGTLVLGVDGVITPTNLFVPTTGNVTPAAAVFGVNGLSGTSYTVSIPSGTVSLTKQGGTETMDVSAFSVKLASKVAGVTTGTIGADNSFAVGATLTIPTTQAEGKYTGSFPVSISYN
ncbi:MAG: DUF4402 domain-containing protein [Bacteroidales bacterium]|nr:DUF4402 domain-containing protein [Bacteroidales bacterium]